MFTFDRNYQNREQVRPFMADFLAIFDEVAAGKSFAYNDDFIGRIPGLVGSDDEGTGIYLLQSLRSIDAEAARVADMEAGVDGWREIQTIDRTRRFDRVLIYLEGRYVGGTGEMIEREDARVVPGIDGCLHAMLPKGKSRRGWLVAGRRVFVVGKGKAV